MTFIQKPDNLCLSRNIPKVIVSSEDVFSFELKKGEDVLFSASYTPDKNNRAEIDIREIVHTSLSFTLKEQTTSYVQSNLVADFTISLNSGELTASFRAIRAGVDRSSVDAAIFLKANFLTWQPQVKKVTYSTPEYLTFYAVSDCVVRLKAYFNEGEETTSEEIELYNASAGSAYTLPMEYAVIAAKLDSRFPSFYDVWVEDTVGARLTYVQRYVASDILSEREHWILFENSLGGIDTIRAYGQCDFTADHTHNIAVIDEVSTEYSVDTERIFEKSTGYLTPQERTWLLDFLPSAQKYIFAGNALRPIVVTEDNTAYTEEDLPSEYTFSYKYADATPLLNITRAEELPEVLDIKVPDLGSFSIPPRLIEFPSLNLSEGALFPVQHPFSENWAVTTAGELYNYIFSRISANPESGTGGTGHTHANYSLLSALSLFQKYLLVNGEKINAGTADLANELSEEGYKKVLRKDKPDSTEYVITFLQGVEFGKFVSGALGTGGAVTIDENGNSHAEFDYLTIRKVALFIELIIQEAKAVGGMLVVSPSGMTVSKVEETSTAYRCYFERTDGDRTLKNQFTVGTQARRQTFNLTGQAYYWRLVTAVGEDYVDLSKTDCDTGSTIPQAGDELVGLGHRTDKTRQAAIIISAFGDDSPSIKYYQGIDSFSLVDKEVKMDYYDNTNGRFKSITYGDTYVGARDKSTYVKYDQEEGVEVKGRVNIQSGSTGAGNFSDLPDEIAKAVDIGGENLLLNTGFTGDYDVQKLSSSTKLNQKTKLYSPSLQGWTGSAEIVEEAASGSGYACKLGNISQPVLLIPGEKYVFGFWAKGNSVEISCGGQTYKQAVTSSYQFYVVRFTYQSGGVFMLSGDATVYNLKLERGTIATDWCPSSKDAPAIADRFKYLWYIQDAIKGNTSIMGGLILSTMLQLGKYTDGVMEKVNAGISGIYNDDQDVAFWAGGTFEQAIATVQKILSGEVPADEEWSTLAKFVATHGGDIFLRGYIYALGGVFRGTIYAKDGEFNGKVSIGNGNILLNKDGSGQLAGGNIKWDKNNFLQINSIISSPFVGLSGVLNEESKRWIFSIGKFMDSFKNNFWLNMDEIYGTEYSAYIEFPYKKEWEGSSVMFFNRGLLQSLKTTGTDWDEKELLPGKLYRFVLINTDDLTKWYCQEL